MSTSSEQQEPSFGKRLRRLREAAGLTQEELAGRAGLTSNAISDLERGRRQRPYPHTVRSLADALELTQDERTSFLASVPRGRPGGSAAPAPSTKVPSSSLPVPPTLLVGRRREVAALSSSLLAGEDLRLVTLTGAGGVGKTRLALEVARRIGNRFPEGVAFVALASLSDATLFVPTVAQALGLREFGGRPVRELLHGYLRNRRVLMVLDNYEHLLEAAAEVAELLAASPSLKVLATSRAPLRVRGEHEYPVAPLAVPDPAHAPDTEGVVGAPAVELFVERAREASPSFTLTSRNAAAVAAICWRLGGLPLALELAAAQARFLGPTELLSRLDQALEAGGARDLPERQRTMQATLSWSYGLLSEPERSLFRRLSVFAGGFTLESAEAVSAEGEAGTGNVLGRLGALVEQSLVMVEASPDTAEGTRYGMLEPIRQYARAKLEGSEEEQVRGRHAGCYEALALRAERELKGAGQVEWMGLLGREHDNLHAAMGWLLGRGEAERVVKIGWGIWWFWFVRGFLVEGRRWMERALAPGATLSAICQAKALTVVAGLAWAQGEYDRAAATLAESVQLARDADDRTVLATALLLTAFTAVARGDRAGAAAWADESYLLHRALGDGSGACLAMLAAAHAAGAGGDSARAVRLVDEGEALARESGASFNLASALNVRAMFLQMEGDDARAAGLLRESLGLSWALRDTYALGYGLTSLAGALVGLGQGERAARLYGAAEALREVTGIPIQYELRRALYKRQVAALHEQLDTEALKAAWAEGRAMTLEEAVTEAVAQGV